MTPVPRSFSQHYKQGNLVAAGSAASVYHCAPVSKPGPLSGELCAKVTKHEDDPLLLEAARTEFKILQMLDHPGIVKAHDFFEGTFASTLVLDFVPGKNLDELVSQLADHSPRKPGAHEFRYQQAEHV